MSDDSIKMMQIFLNYRIFTDFDEYTKARTKVPEWLDIPGNYIFFK